MHHLPRVEPGDEIRAAEINALFEAAGDLGLMVEGDLELVQSPGGRALIDNRPWSGWAKTSGTPVGSGYAWAEQVPASGGTFTTGPRSGTTSSFPLYESNGVTSVPANTIVPARYEPAANAFLFTY